MAYNAADYDYTDEDYGPPIPYMDQSRTDLLARGDMLQILKFLWEEPLDGISPSKKKMFFSSTGKALHATFFEKEDEADMLLDHEYSSLIYGMRKPRSEKTVNDVVQANELRMHVLTGIRRSQGFRDNRVNMLTLASTIVKQNVHTMADANPSGGGGIMGGIKGLFKKF